MKLKVMLTVAILFLAASSLFAQNRTKPLNPAIDSMFPSRPTTYLTDLAGIIKNPAEVNARLAVIRDSNHLSLVAVTLSSTHGYSPEEVATEIGRKWFVATANDTAGNVIRNTGGVILISMDPRRCQIATATGSEGYMTDYRAAEACRSVRNEFRAGNFGAGLIVIANTFVKYHNDELAAAAAAKLPKPPSKPFPWGILLYIALILIPLGAIVGRYVYLKNKEEQERERLERIRQRAEYQKWEEERDRQAQAAEAVRQERERIAAEKEKARWNSLTPEQQKEELRKKAETAKVAAIAAAAAAVADAARRKREEEEYQARRRREEEEESYRSSSSSSNDDDSSGGGSDNWSSGGSDSFSGGGGGSSF